MSKTETMRKILMDDIAAKHPKLSFNKRLKAIFAKETGNTITLKDGGVGVSLKFVTVRIDEKEYFKRWGGDCHEYSRNTRKDHQPLD